MYFKFRQNGWIGTQQQESLGHSFSPLKIKMNSENKEGANWLEN
jgi:hypothetical protein